MPDGTIYKDSWEILETFYGPVDKYWKKILDHKLGIAVRQLAYYYYLDPQNKTLINNIVKQTTPAERFFWFLFGNQVKKSMYDLLIFPSSSVYHLGHFQKICADSMSSTS